MKTILFLFFSTLLFVIHAIAAPDRESRQKNNTWDSLRDPFWPVGYHPKEHTPDAIKTNIVEKIIKWPVLEPIAKMNKQGTQEYIVVIKNYGPAEKGDIIKIEKDGLIYKWLILDITSSGIQVKKLEVFSKKHNLIIKDK